MEENKITEMKNKDSLEMIDASNKILLALRVIIANNNLNEEPKKVFITNALIVAIKKDPLFLNRKLKTFGGEGSKTQKLDAVKVPGNTLLLNALAYEINPLVDAICIVEETRIKKGTLVNNTCFNIKNTKIQTCGNSPLTLAIKTGRFNVAKFLVENGADPNLSAYVGGFTPLHLAVLRLGIKPLCTEHEKLQIKDLIELLIKQGANKDALDNFGNTPYSYLNLSSKRQEDYIEFENVYSILYAGNIEGEIVVYDNFDERIKTNFYKQKGRTLVRIVKGSTLKARCEESFYYFLSNYGFNGITKRMEKIRENLKFSSPLIEELKTKNNNTIVQSKFDDIIACRMVCSDLRIGFNPQTAKQRQEKTLSFYPKPENNKALQNN